MIVPCLVLTITEFRLWPVEDNWMGENKFHSTGKAHQTET